MASIQLSIPGLRCGRITGPQLKVKKPSTGEQLASLESRVRNLELEVSLLRILMDKEDEDHA